jgi:5-methyltetrahydropteroyltriglutamate--homocysteine methyltransferase
MFTATANVVLPSTTTGSFPRPRWFDVSMWGRPLDTCMLDVRFREKFQDALAVVIADQERAGLDVLTHGDFHCDEDMGGPRLAPLSAAAVGRLRGRSPAAGSDHAPWLHYPPGTLLNEIYTGWRWPHVVDKIEHRPLDYAKLWRHRAEQDAQADQVRHLLLAGDGAVPRHPHAEVQGQAPGDLGHGRGHEHGAAGAARRRLPVHPDRGADLPLHGQHVRQGPRGRDVHDRRLQPRGAGLDDVELWIHTCWGNPNMQRVMDDTSYAASIEIYLERCRATSGRSR